MWGSAWACCNRDEDVDGREVLVFDPRLRPEIGFDVARMALQNQKRFTRLHLQNMQCETGRDGSVSEDESESALVGASDDHQQTQTNMFVERELSARGGRGLSAGPAKPSTISARGAGATQTSQRTHASRSNGGTIVVPTQTPEGIAVGAVRRSFSQDSGMLAPVSISRQHAASNTEEGSRAPHRKRATTLTLKDRSVRNGSSLLQITPRQLSPKARPELKIAVPQFVRVVAASDYIDAMRRTRSTARGEASRGFGRPEMGAGLGPRERGWDLLSQSRASPRTKSPPQENDTNFVVEQDGAELVLDVDADRRRTHSKSDSVSARASLQEAREQKAALRAASTGTTSTRRVAASVPPPPRLLDRGSLHQLGTYTPRITLPRQEGMLQPRARRQVQARPPPRLVPLPSTDAIRVEPRFSKTAAVADVAPPGVEVPDKDKAFWEWKLMYVLSPRSGSVPPPRRPVITQPALSRTPSPPVLRPTDFQGPVKAFGAQIQANLQNSHTNYLPRLSQEAQWARLQSQMQKNEPRYRELSQQSVAWIAGMPTQQFGRESEDEIDPDRGGNYSQRFRPVESVARRTTTTQSRASVSPAAVTRQGNLTVDEREERQQRTILRTPTSQGVAVAAAAASNRNSVMPITSLARFTSAMQIAGPPPLRAQSAAPPQVVSFRDRVSISNYRTSVQGAPALKLNKHYMKTNDFRSISAPKARTHDHESDLEDGTNAKRSSTVMEPRPSIEARNVIAARVARQQYGRHDSTSVPATAVLDRDPRGQDHQPGTKEQAIPPKGPSAPPSVRGPGRHQRTEVIRGPPLAASASTRGVARGQSPRPKGNKDIKEKDDEDMNRRTTHSHAREGDAVIVANIVSTKPTPSATGSPPKTNSKFQSIARRAALLRPGAVAVSTRLYSTPIRGGATTPLSGAGARTPPPVQGASTAAAAPPPGQGTPTNLKSANVARPLNTPRVTTTGRGDTNTPQTPSKATATLRAAASQIVHKARGAGVIGKAKAKAVAAAPPSSAQPGTSSSAERAARALVQKMKAPPRTEAERLKTLALARRGVAPPSALMTPEVEETAGDIDILEGLHDTPSGNQSEARTSSKEADGTPQNVESLAPTGATPTNTGPSLNKLRLLSPADRSPSPPPRRSFEFADLASAPVYDAIVRSCGIMSESQEHIVKRFLAEGATAFGSEDIVHAVGGIPVAATPRGDAQQFLPPPRVSPPPGSGNVVEAISTLVPAVLQLEQPAVLQPQPQPPAPANFGVARASQLQPAPPPQMEANRRHLLRPPSSSPPAYVRAGASAVGAHGVTSLKADQHDPYATTTGEQLQPIPVTTGTASTAREMAVGHAKSVVDQLEEIAKVLKDSHIPSPRAVPAGINASNDQSQSAAAASRMARRSMEDRFRPVAPVVTAAHMVMAEAGSKNIALTASKAVAQTQRMSRLEQSRAPQEPAVGTNGTNPDPEMNSRIEYPFAGAAVDINVGDGDSSLSYPAGPSEDPTRMAAGRLAARLVAAPSDHFMWRPEGDRAPPPSFQRGLEGAAMGMTAGRDHRPQEQHYVYDYDRGSFVVAMPRTTSATANVGTSVDAVSSSSAPTTALFYREDHGGTRNSNLFLLPSASGGGANSLVLPFSGQSLQFSKDYPAVRGQLNDTVRSEREDQNEYALLGDARKRNAAFSAALGSRQPARSSLLLGQKLVELRKLF